MKPTPPPVNFQALGVWAAHATIDLLRQLIACPSSCRRTMVRSILEVLLDLESLPDMDLDDVGSIERQVRETGRRMLHEASLRRQQQSPSPAGPPPGGS